MKINHKLVYEVRRLRLNTGSKANVRVQFENRARVEADSAHEQYLAFLRKHIGHDDFEVTSIMCMADGISGHVYSRDKHTGGPLAKRDYRCVFCGLSDDDVY